MKDILKIVMIGLVLTTFGMFIGCEGSAERPGGVQYEQRQMPEEEGQEQEEGEEEEEQKEFEIPQG